MSFNPFPNSNNYSPYFQQASSGQDTNGQYSNQQRNTHGYQSSNTYQPLSAYQTQNSGSYGGTQAKGGYAAGRSSLDTSALGNLAYASSLGRNNSPSSQTFNRKENAAPATAYGNSYGTASQPNQYSSNYGRSEGDGSSVSRPEYQQPQVTTSSPSFGYSTNAATSGYQAGSGHSQAYNAGTQQQQRYSTQAYEPNQYNNPPSRPSSGQAVYTHSRTTSHGLPSPAVSGSQAAPSNVANQYSNHNRAVGTARVPTPQQSNPYHTSQPPASSQAGNDTTISTQAATGRQNPVPTKTNNRSHSATQSPYSAPALPTNVRQIETVSRSNGSSTPTHTSTTVDPSQVFNDTEYRRRQAAAAAEADAARKKAEAEKQTAAQAKGPVTGQNTDMDKEEEMELEMKTMIEKMRDYKKKDPLLFSQIWETVKKGQTPKAPSQAAAQGSGGSAISPVVVDGQSPGPTQAQLPPESELSVTEPVSSDLADRGRFPAQRRRRGGSSMTPKKSATPQSSKKTSSAQKNQSQAVSDPGKGLVQNTTPSRPTGAPVAQMRQHPSATSAPPAETTAPPKTGGTYWPENKKQQLAEAAKAALLSTPANAKKSVTTNELHELLDQNPSYTQMCEILERRGFVIDRAMFARNLLSTVPDLGAAGSKPASAPAVPARPPSHGLPVQRPLPYSTPYAPPPDNVQPGPSQGPQSKFQFVGPNTSTVPLQHPAVAPMQTSGSTNPPTQIYSGYGPVNANATNQAQKKARTGPTVPTTTTKQDMARKRSFGEIVDLTQAMSDDEIDDEPPPKQPRLEEPAPLPQENNNQAPHQPLDKFIHNPASAPAGKYLHSKDIVQPMNKRQDALRRSSYNPKTIARDILIALGKHPNMAHLNAHLDSLQRQFSAVNYDSDLSTFRWDLIDPGGPPPPPPPIPETNSPIEITKSPLRPTPQNRSRMAVVVGGSSSNDKSSNTAAANGVSEHQDPKASTPSDVSSGHRFFSKPQKTPSSAGTPGTKGRVGRPPGAKNKNPRPEKGIPKKTRPSFANQHTPATQDQEDFSRQSKEDPTSGSGNGTPFQPLSNSTPPSRPRIETTPAKPSGLRNVITPADGIAVVIPSRSPSVAGTPSSTSKGRRFSDLATLSNHHAPPPPQPSYAIHKCHWDACPAELHSLETLRKHVRKHRSKRDFKHGPLHCLWEGCYEDGEVGERERLSFADEGVWEEHVLRVHVGGETGKDDGGGNGSGGSGRKPGLVLSVGVRPMVVVD